MCPPWERLGAGPRFPLRELFLAMTKAGSTPGIPAAGHPQVLSLPKTVSGHLVLRTFLTNQEIYATHSISTALL